MHIHCSWTLILHIQGLRHCVQVLVTAFTVVPSRSGAVRTFEQRTVLEQFNPRCVAVSLSGYIFFGSSVKISDKVLEVNALQPACFLLLSQICCHS